MKKIFVLFFLTLLLSACSEENNRCYVKNMDISLSDDEYTLKIVYYDFENKTEDYLEKEYTGTDIYKLGIEAMGDRLYNFRLCEKVFINSGFLKNDIVEIIELINRLKVSPSADIIAYHSPKAFKEADFNIKNPLYNLSYENKKVIGSFPVISDNGSLTEAVVINDNKHTTIKNISDYTVLKIMENCISESEYIVNDSTMWAYINNCKTSYAHINNNLQIVISFRLREYKGRYNSVQDKDKFIEILKKDISQRAFNLYKNKILSDFANLDWYSKQVGKKFNKIDIVVKVI